MPAYVLARLLREQAKLLPAAHTPRILLLIVIPSNTLLLPSILLLKGELCRTCLLSRRRLGGDGLAFHRCCVLRMIYPDDLFTVLAPPYLPRNLVIVIVIL